jgi:hypothetical protein
MKRGDRAYRTSETRGAIEEWGDKLMMESDGFKDG